MSELVRTVVLHPLDAVVRSFEPYKLKTLLLLFMPLGLLPLLGWRALLVALPSLAYTYLSARPNQFVIAHQYFSPALGWLVVGAAQGWSLWVGLWRQHWAAPAALGRWRIVTAVPLAVALMATITIDAILSPIKPSATVNIASFAAISAPHVALCYARRSRGARQRPRSKAPWRVHRSAVPARNWCAS